MGTPNPRIGLLLLSIVLMLLSNGLTIIADEDHQKGRDHHDDHDILINDDGFNHDNDDPYRTAYHFQPPRNWMNDPNGPMIYKGIYHFFYQYYPYDAVWHTEIVWGHSTSTDLINWTPQPVALVPSEPYDINGCWSGSVTILPGDKPAILYTGIDSKKFQVQNLALPKNLSDPYLREWVKVPQNPLMVGTPTTNNINASEFRDPSTAWKLQDGKWRVIVGTQQGKRGLAVLYTSDDFITWNYSERPLHSAEHTGVWECPDFFPVYVDKLLGADTSTVGEDVKHVLKISVFDTKYEYYTVGSYDIDKDIYVPDEGSIESDMGLRYDYGKFYASKSFFDSKTNRRILWGWVNESSIQNEDIKKGWSGIQAIPRTIVLDKSGKKLVQWPVEEVETLRGHKVELPPQVIKGGSLTEIPGVTASQVDVEISFRLPKSKHVEEFDLAWTNPQILCSEKETSTTTEGKVGPFGLLTLASEGLEEFTAVFFRVFKGTNRHVVLMCSDPSRSSLNPTTDKLVFGTFVDVDPLKDELSLRILIDHSIVESFGAEGKSCITTRVYPTLAVNNKAKLYAFNYGTEDVEITKLSAWNMKKAQMNLPTEDSYKSKHHNNKVDKEDL